MRDAVICKPVRTPIGRFGAGSLSLIPVVDTVTRHLVGPVGLDDGPVDDVIPGHCYANGESPAIGRLNVNGSGISLGHPVGATGTRLLAAGSRKLARRNGRYLLVNMRIGGEHGPAAVIERMAIAA